MMRSGCSLAIAALAWTALLVLGCSPPRTTLVITLNNPSGLRIDALRVAASYQKTQLADAQTWPKQEVRQRMDQFVVDLPWFSAGVVTLVVGGLDPQQCRIAQARLEVAIDARSEYHHTMTLAPLAETERGCEVLVTPIGAGQGSVGVSDGSRRPSLECAPGLACGYRAGFGTILTLRAQASADAYFVGWSGACHGPGDCVVQIGDEQARVGAGFEPRTVCTGQAPSWCWENPLPQGNTLHAVWAVSARDVWAVGDGGTILHWNGDFWAAIPAVGKEVALRAVWASAADDVWVVGANGTMLRGDAASLRPVALQPAGPLTDEVSLLAVWGTSRDDVWLTGISRDQGSIWHWDGASFQLIDARPAATWYLSRIWGSGANDVWFVGDRGVVVRWTGQLPLQGMPRQTDLDIVDISGSGPNDVWLVGLQRGSLNAGLALHYDADQRPALMRFDEPVTGVWVNQHNDVWSIGAGGRIRRWRGAAWTDVAGVSTSGSGPRSALGPPSYLAVHGASTDDVWFVGQGGALDHWNGAQVLRTTSGTQANLSSVWVVSPTEVWAAGDQGTLLRSSGQIWVDRRPNFSNPLLSLWASGANDVWIGSTLGIVFRWDGQTLKAKLLSPSGLVTAIWGADKSHVWLAVATSDSSTTLVRSDGQTSVEIASVPGVVLGLWGSSDRDVWAVGSQGSIQHWDGGAWRLVPPDAAWAMRTLNDVWGSSATDIWIVGDGGTLLHSEDGQSVHPAAGPQVAPGADWVSVWTSGPKDVWLVGSRDAVSNRIYQYDGTRWDAFYGTEANVQRIRGANQQVWAVGGQGSILHYGGPR